MTGGEGVVNLYLDGKFPFGPLIRPYRFSKINNAVRALAVMASASTRPTRGIPIEPFIGAINSPVWTDRNKASLALGALSESRNPELLAKLRHQAIESLVEMARWKSTGHAMPALKILGRIGGWSDEDVQAALKRGEREAVINAALSRR